MKNNNISLVIFLFLVFLGLSSKLSAQFYHVSEESTGHKIVHFNPLEGLKSADPQIRLDCAYMLGELNATKADIALMKALREDEDQAVRIVAALSLIKMESPIGVHLVKRIAELSDCPRTCRILKKFYNSYAKHKALPNQELNEYQIASLIYEK